MLTDASRRPTSRRTQLAFLLPGFQWLLRRSRETQKETLLHVCYYCNMDPHGEDGPLQESGDTGVDSDSRDGSGECCVYRACQDVSSAVGVVAATYYCKDVLRVQPAAAQFYQGIIDAPWVVKLLRGLLTDIVPVVGYRRRPYFLLTDLIWGTPRQPPVWM